jgi:hypothetical protein
VAGDGRKVDVTIIRPRTDEIPREVGIGLTIVAKLIAERIREKESGERNGRVRRKREDGVELPDPGERP